MAITGSTPSGDKGRPFKMGTFDAQFIDVSAVSGATSGTLTAKWLARFQHVLLPKGFVQTSAPDFSGNNTAQNFAVLAFTVPAETKATATINGILYTAAANLGAAGNSVTVQLVDGTGDVPPVTNGNETVSVTSSAIVVHMDPTAVSGSTETNVRIAVNASTAAAALVVATGSSATVASVTAATPLTGGVTGGAAGTALCLGVP